MFQIIGILTALGVILALPSIPKLKAQNNPVKSNSTHVAEFQKSNAQLHLVTAIIDGDTIVVDDNGHEQQVRLLGIDTPELRTLHSKDMCFGQEATLFTTSALRYRLVSLESDSKNRDTDDYGRWLRYVDIPVSNGSFIRLNEMLTFGGYAKTMPEYPLSQIQKYRDLELSARESQKGLWKRCR